MTISMTHSSISLLMLSLLAVLAQSVDAGELVKRRKLSEQISVNNQQSFDALLELAHASPVVQMLNQDTNSQGDTAAALNVLLHDTERDLLMRYATALKQEKPTLQESIKSLSLYESLTLLATFDRLHLKDDADVTTQIARNLIKYAATHDFETLLSRLPLYDQLSEQIRTRMIAVLKPYLQQLIDSQKHDLFDLVQSVEDRVEGFALSSDGTRIRYVILNREREDRGEADMYDYIERDSTSGEIVRSVHLAHIDEEVQTLNMSPDGRWLMYEYLGDMHHLYLYDVEQQQERSIAFDRNMVAQSSLGSYVMSADNSTLILEFNDELEEEIEENDKQVTHGSLYSYSMNDQVLTPLITNLSYGLRGSRVAVNTNGTYCVASYDLSPAQKKQFDGFQPLIKVIHIPTQTSSTLYHSAADTFYDGEYQSYSPVFLNDTTIALVGSHGKELRIDLATLKSGELNDCATLGIVYNVVSPLARYSFSHGDYCIRTGMTAGDGAAVQKHNDPTFFTFSFEPQDALSAAENSDEESAEYYDWKGQLAFCANKQRFKKLSVEKLLEKDTQLKSLTIEQLCLMSAVVTKLKANSLKNIAVTAHLYDSLPPLVLHSLRNHIEKQSK